MVHPLRLVNLTEDTAPSNALLARVGREIDERWRLDEKVAVREASFLTPRHPDYIFFRRFNDGRSSQIAAYVVDNINGRFTNKELAELHRNIWLSGNTPLLYVGRQGCVDIYSCAGSASKGKRQEWLPKPFDTIRLSSEIAEAKKIRQFSAFRLADGTFWEDNRNASLVNPNRSAHRRLIAEVEQADRQLHGSENLAARHLLLLTLLLKYLEDREVFPPGWFSQFYPNSPSCLHVFKYGGKNATLAMFRALAYKFNGDIFHISPEHIAIIDNALLQRLTNLICKNLESKSGQFYLWDIYSFKYIPVEVLSHIYQHFADSDKGAVFTPPMVVNLMLDQIMPLNTLVGDETILDPACGSGIFLVSAFRRLVHVWCNKRNWKRPTPVELTELLSKTIFGIELQPQAAELASFSLALAICDALQPDVIWEQLRFDNLLNSNIFNGDYCEFIDIIKDKTKNEEGFDIIIGNPPFMSHLTDGMKKRAKKFKYNIPDKQSGYFFLIDCATKALLPNGKICMLQKDGLLYNNNVKNFLNTCLKSFTFEAILDFISIRGLFKSADTKVIAIVATNVIPSKKIRINHLTFRRTFAADNQIYFELDYYDYHSVSLDSALKFTWCWRANLLGGGRLFYLAKRLSQFPTIKDEVTKRGWDAGEGYIVGNKCRRISASWLYGMRLLPTEALSDSGIDNDMIEKVNDTLFAAPRTLQRYTPPLLLIKENDTLSCAFWNDGNLAYKHKIIGIHASTEDSNGLYNFFKQFVVKKKYLRAACYLLGSQLLTNKATVPVKADIDRLPWPPKGNWELADWEQQMLSDINTYMAEYVRLGQDSVLLKNPLGEKDRQKYVDIFLSVIRKIFPDTSDIGHGHTDGLAYQAFNLHGSSAADSICWLNSNWVQYARNVLFVPQGDSESFLSSRLLRVYEDNTIILIKPDRLRYWIGSVAIRDVDDVLYDMMSGDEQNA